MRSRLPTLGFIAAALASSLLPATAQGTREQGPEIAVARHAAHGAYLTDGSGLALYMFTTDTQAKGDRATPQGETASSCYDACAQNWPPLLVETGQEPRIKDQSQASMIGTFRRKDGKMQVTYNGWPLYRYAEDKSSADAKGQGVDGKWYLLNPTGEPLK
jgi:predicted lipoprotein with Yx(FWY)xxD motif